MHPALSALAPAQPHSHGDAALTLLHRTLELELAFARLTSCLQRRARPRRRRGHPPKMILK
jgi:hypothetical protein